MVVRVCIRLRSHFEPARDSLGLGLNPCPLVEPVPLPPAFDLLPALIPAVKCSGDRGIGDTTEGEERRGAMHIRSLGVFLFLALVTILPFTIDETAVVRSSTLFPPETMHTSNENSPNSGGGFFFFFFLVGPENIPSCACWVLGKRHRARFGWLASRPLLHDLPRRTWSSSRASKPKRTRLLYYQ